MKSLSILFLINLTFTSIFLNAQVPSIADKAKERYQQRITAADKNKSDGIDKLTLAYDAEIKSAQAEVKRIFDPLIRAAAIRNKTDDVRDLTLQMESIINPDGVMLSDQETTSENSTPSTGSNFIQLVGKWKTSGSSRGSTDFEFKNPRTAIITTQTYSTQGGSGSYSTEYKVAIKKDKMIFEQKVKPIYSDSSYKSWYEIKIPFEMNPLEVTRFSERSDGSSKMTYLLEREE